MLLEIELFTIGDKQPVALQDEAVARIVEKPERKIRAAEGFGRQKADQRSIGRQFGNIGMAEQDHGWLENDILLDNDRGRCPAPALVRQGNRDELLGAGLWRRVGRRVGHCMNDLLHAG